MLCRRSRQGRWIREGNAFRLKAIHTIDRLDVLPSSAIRPSARGGVATHTPLWVGGVAALCLLLAIMVKVPLTAISARVDVWTPYLVLGTLFPLVVAAVVLLERSGRALPASVGLLLSALPITAVAHFAGVGRNLLAVGLALVQTVLYLMMAGWCWPRMPLHFSLRRQPPGSSTVEIALKPLSLQATQMLALFVMGFLAWAVVLEMMTWEMAAVMRPPHLYEYIGGALALLACCWWASGREIPTNRLWTWARGITSVGSVIILVLLAFRTDGLFTTDQLDSFNLPGSYLHWGAFVGPAEAVRQGGWLLWDVPFQYGFLTTLSLAALPVPTAWQSLYLFSAIGSAVVAVFLFVVLRAVRPTVAGTIVAGAVSAAVVFLLPAQPILLAPVHYLPSNGVIRHWWCYVLVAVLLLERRQAPRSRAQQGLLLAGCVSWLLAILWSAESA